MKGGFLCLKEKYAATEKDLCDDACPDSCKTTKAGMHTCNTSGIGRAHV